MSDPDEHRTDLFLNPGRDGFVEYGLMKGGKTAATTRVHGKNVAAMVGELLMAAWEADEQTRAQGLNDYPVSMSIVEPSRLGVMIHSDKPEHLTVYFEFGRAAIAMALPPAIARHLAEQMLATLEEFDR